jgi:hypothetical protein
LLLLRLSLLEAFKRASLTCALEEIVSLVVRMYVSIRACMLVVHELDGFQPSLFHYDS